MKKFLCLALVLCLALAPVGVFAEEYDNGENGYDYEVVEYDNGDEPTGYENGDEPTGYENDEPTGEVVAEAEEVEPVAVEGVAEGIEAIAADLGQVWSFGMDEAAEGFSFLYYVDGDFALATYEDGLWVASVEGWTIDAASGDVTPVEGVDAAIVWYAQADGVFYLTGSVVGNDFVVSVLLNGEVGAVFEADADLHFELTLAEGDELAFVTSGTETVTWSIVIREVVVLEEDVVPTDEGAVTDDELEALPAEPVVDYPLPGVLVGVPTRTVDGVEFVAFRLFVNAMGDYALAWDGATSTVTVVDVVSFTVAEAGGFNDNGTVYVPMAFALSLF